MYKKLLCIFCFLLARTAFTVIEVPNERSLPDAITRANGTAEPILFTKDITNAQELIISKTYTIDGQNFKLSGSGNVDINGNSIVTTWKDLPATLGDLVVTSGELLITGNSEITAKGGGVDQGGGILTLSSTTAPVTFKDHFGTGVYNIGTNCLLIMEKGLFQGELEGVGTLEKQSNSKLQIDYQQPSFLGTIKISAGKLELTDNLNSNVKINLNGGTLTLKRTFGGTLIQIGELSGSSGTINFLESNVLDVANGSFGGAFSGTGTIRQTGSGFLTYSGNSTAAKLTLDQGELRLQQTLGNALNDLTVNGTGRLTGSGFVGTLSNSATVAPGTSAGVITVTDYTHDSSATLEMEVFPDGTHDQLVVTGTATINGGTLLLKPAPGIYSSTIEYKIIDTTGGGSITGSEFDQHIENHPLDFIFIPGSNTFRIRVERDEAVFPIDIPNLSGNAHRIGSYLYCDSGTFLPPGEDIRLVTEKLAALSPDEFKKKLTLLTPQQFRSLTLSSLQTQLQAARGMMDSDLPCDAFWVQPMGYYYRQSSIKNSCGFDTKAYGLTTGVSKMLGDHFCFQGGLSYVNSNLHFGTDAGDADLNTFLLGANIRYKRGHGFVNGAILFGRTFYDVDRTISLPELKRTAHNDHKSWDLQGALQGGYRFPCHKLVNDFYIEPSAHVNFVSIFESGYQESGANSLNLSVQNKTALFLRSLFELKFLKDFATDNWFFTPSVNLGYSNLLSLNDGDYTSRLYKQRTCKDHFITATDDATKNQLVLGADYLMTNHTRFSLDLKYRATIGQHSPIQEYSAHFNWKF